MKTLYEDELTIVFIDASGEVFFKNKHHPKSQIRIINSPNGIISVVCPEGTLTPGTHSTSSCIKAYPGHIKCD